MALRGKAVGGANGIDCEQVQAALAVLADPAHGCQLHGLPSGECRTAPGSDLNALVQAARSLAYNANLYYSINPVPVGLTRSARKADILHRRNFLVDLDPVKAPGHEDDPATDEEHRRVAEVAHEVIDDLCDRGWPLPVLIDSGNGYHLLWRINLPNTPHGQALCKAALKALSDTYTGDRAVIDTACHDARRIAKLPGSTARKGTPSPERPYRPVRLLQAPRVMEEVTAEQMAQLAGLCAEEGKDEPPPPRPTPDARWSRLKGKATGGSGGLGRAYALDALEGERQRILNARPCTAEGRNVCLNRAAYALAGFVESGLLDPGEIEQALKDAAAQAGLGELEINRTFASGYAAGAAAPRAVLEQNGHVSTRQAQAPEPQGEWQFFLDDELLAEGDPAKLAGPAEEGPGTGKRAYHLRTMGNLLRTEFPEPAWIVPGIMSEGMNLLAGAPKQGKSMLALNLALTVAGGGMALGNIQVVAGAVLYLSLEDKQRRVKARAMRMLKNAGEAPWAQRALANLTIATEWPRQDEYGLRLIDLWARNVKDPRLIIIDVWPRFSARFRQAAGTNYAQDAEAAGEVKRWCDRRGIGDLNVCHTRKPAGGSDGPADFLNEVSGTQGLAGTADGVLVLLRSRQESEAHLHITGRDVQEQELVLKFDADTLTWTCLGTAEEQLEGDVQKAIVEFLRHAGPAGAYVKDIAAAIKRPDGSVRKLCHRMFSSGIIRRNGNAWAWPGAEEEAPQDPIPP